MFRNYGEKLNVNHFWELKGFNLSLRKSYSQFSLLTSLHFLVKKQKALRPNQDNKFKLISLSILITYLLDKVFKFQKEFTFLPEN